MIRGHLTSVFQEIRNSLVVRSRDVALEHTHVALQCATWTINEDSAIMRELKIPQVIQVETAVALGAHQVARL